MPSPLPVADADLAQALIPLARRAGDAILDIYRGDFEVLEKADTSPVTAADHAAEAIILEGLKGLTPDIPIVAEEEMAAGRLPELGEGAFWLVDPLDGTKEFIKRRDSFTVNIGLVDATPAGHLPRLGVVLAPALDLLYVGHGPGTARLISGGAERPIACRQPPAEGLTVLASRSHGDPTELDRFLAPYKVAEIINAGSSLKFCRLAEGVGDLYPRLGPTSEWDTAAAHAVLMAAGGSVTTLDGKPFTYGKGPTFLNPPFVAKAYYQPTMRGTHRRLV
ncbi:3'(2'),5'-bisphosphate nucleotidase CysQ [Roseospirillum parvum]|uniref:3'(2'),5'-bisphosphate nucleotidase CysQ n=1 Tax=Roseospirillum parvum TaxID=83401 RepID=A0A1G7TQ08_9PROT|nr:3'(2'),5'-bisphosphate nucleotidase CysQ [Roseospirillum parvum]SDG37413.1 3'(2'), 5'-bisphosphate nucleotidase [Roseospirillum parvum]